MGMRGSIVRYARAGALAAAMLTVGMASAAEARPFNEPFRTSFVTAPTTAGCLAAVGIACYSPSQFETAYNMNGLYGRGLAGQGETIAIVDSFGSPNIAGDLATFDRDFGLPAPPSLRIIAPAGPIPPFDPTSSDHIGWAFETSLDVEYAHAMAPAAKILLVETPTSETIGTAGFPEIVKAENYVIDHHMADVISQSFGAAEPTFPNPQSLLALRGAYWNALAHRVTVLAASGDAGRTDFSDPFGSTLFTRPVASWPASDPLVTSVGGTQLHLDANGNRTAPDNVWNDTQLLGVPAASGGGVSSIFSRPFYQDAVKSIVGDQRGYPDVSLTAAVDGGALVYLSLPGVGAGYQIVGGTSEATPMVAGITAVADQAAGTRIGLLNPWLYPAVGMPGFPDITRGNTTVTFTQNGSNYTIPGYTAVPGYDLASGIGTVDGGRVVSQFVRRR